MVDTHHSDSGDEADVPNTKDVKIRFKKPQGKRRRESKMRVKVSVPTAVREWLLESYQSSTSHVIPKTRLFNDYVKFCFDHGLEPKQNNIFGRIVSQVFPSVYTRRIGPKGKQECHYAGIQPKVPTFSSTFDNSNTTFSPFSPCATTTTTSTTSSITTTTTFASFTNSQTLFSTMSALNMNNTTTTPDLNSTNNSLASSLDVFPEPTGQECMSMEFSLQLLHDEAALPTPSLTSPSFSTFMEEVEGGVEWEPETEDSDSEQSLLQEILSAMKEEDAANASALMTSPILGRGVSYVCFDAPFAESDQGLEDTSCLTSSGNWDPCAHFLNRLEF